MGEGAGIIVLENDETGAQTENHQRRMMGEINKLRERYPDPANSLCRNGCF